MARRRSHSLIIWLMPVTETFTVQIRLFLMITIFAIAAMVMNLLPNMLVAIILPTLYAATGLAPLGTAFSAYSGNFFWMVIGALFLGGIMTRREFSRAYRISSSASSAAASAARCGPCSPRR